MRHVRKAASDIGNFCFLRPYLHYFRLEYFIRLETEILLLELDKVLKMIFLKSIFVLLTTDFLLTGKGFDLLRTCNGCYHTDHIAIPSNTRISLVFRF